MTQNNPFTIRSVAVQALMNQRTVTNKAMAEFIFDNGILVQILKGKAIAEQGKIGDSMFYILSGGVQIQINGHDYFVRQRGELIGEMAVIEPGASRTATMVSTGDETYVVELDSESFQKMCDLFPVAWKLVSEVLASRLRQRDKFFCSTKRTARCFCCIINRSIEDIGESC